MCKTIMGVLVALFLTTTLAPAADDNSLQDKISLLRREAASAVKDGRLVSAEEKLNAALRECDALPPSLFRIKTDLLRDLGGVYSKEKRIDKAESVYKLRLDALTAQQKDGQTPDLDIGFALFDLQSVYEVTARAPEAQAYFERARTFYEDCKAGFPGLRARCDHYLADAEALHGSVLFLQKRFDAAIPFLQAVVAREDSQVRPEVMTAALTAYAQILISRGDTAAAQPLIARVMQIRAAHPSRFP